MAGGITKPTLSKKLKKTSKIRNNKIYWKNIITTAIMEKIQPKFKDLTPKSSIIKKHKLKSATGHKRLSTN